MARRVRIERAIVVHRERLVDTPGEEAERDESLGEDAPRGVMNGVVTVARFRGINGGELGLEHDVVDQALGRGESAIHGKRAGNVGSIIAVLTPGIDQHEVAVLQAAGVLRVVQDTGIGSGGDNRRVAIPGGAVAAKDEFNGGLDFIFVHARLGVAHRFSMGGTGNLAGAPMVYEFSPRAPEAELVKDGVRIFDAAWHGMATRLDGTQLGEELQNLGVVCGVPESVVERGTVDGILPELVTELSDGVGRVGPIYGHGTLWACPASGPHLPLPVPRSDKEDEALRRAGGIDQGHRVRLIKASQKKEVGVLTECIVDIMVPHDLLGTWDNGKPILDRLSKALPPLHEWRDIK